MVEGHLYGVHGDVGVDFPATGANPVEIPFTHEHTTATETFSPYSPLPSAPLYDPCHLIPLVRADYKTTTLPFFDL